MEVGLIECQTCKKKILGTKKILGKIFLKFFSLNLIILYTFELGFINLNFFIYKKLVRINLGIRIKITQCVIVLSMEMTLQVIRLVPLTLLVNC